MRNTHLIFIAFLSFIPSIIFGQEVEVLKKEFAKTKIDTIKLKILSDLHWTTVYENPIEAREYATQELALAIKIKSKKWEAQGYNDLGISEQLDQKLKKALDYHLKALSIRTELCDVSGLGSSYLKVGMLYTQLNELDKALEADLKALLYLRKADNRQGIAYALNNICGILNEQKQIADIEKYATESYQLCNEIGDTTGMGNAANYYAIYLENQKDIPGAEKKYYEALGYFTHTGDSKRISAIFNNLGHLNRDRNRKLALEYYEKSLSIELASSVPDTNSIIGSMLNTASQYNILKDFTKAENYVRMSLKLSQKGAGTKHLIQMYSLLCDIFVQTGEADSAVKYSDSFQIEVEKKFSNEMAANFSKLQTQFEIDLREEQKATLSKENEIKAQKLIRYQFLIGSLLVIMVLAICLFLLIRNRQKMIQKKLLDEERWLQKESRTKAVIEAEEQERQRIARELHDGVGQQLSAARLHLSALEGKFDPTQTREETLLSIAISMMDDAVKEVRSVAHTMLANALLKQGLAGAVRDFIQKINSSGLIKIELEISGLDQKLEPTTESMLFRIIQEIMSNIIRHSGANQVTIQLHRHETELVLMVEDNGVGFDVSVVSSGAGMQNIKSRAAYINGNFEIDSSPGRGTTISVEVKL